MSPNERALFTEYQELKTEISALEERVDLIKKQLIPLIPPDSKIETELGFFTLSSKKVWRYSDEVATLDKQVKDLKKKEEQTGVAEFTDGEPFVVFRQKK